MCVCSKNLAGLAFYFMSLFRIFFSVFTDLFMHLHETDDCNTKDEIFVKEPRLLLCFQPAVQIVAFCYSLTFMTLVTWITYCVTYSAFVQPVVTQPACGSVSTSSGTEWCPGSSFPFGDITDVSDPGKVVIHCCFRCLCCCTKPYKTSCRMGNAHACVRAFGIINLPAYPQSGGVDQCDRRTHRTVRD